MEPVTLPSGLFKTLHMPKQQPHHIQQTGHGELSGTFGLIKGRSAEVFDGANRLGDMLTAVLASLDRLQRESLDERDKRQFDQAQWGALQAAQCARQLFTSSNGSAPGWKGPQYFVETPTTR